MSESALVQFQACRVRVMLLDNDSVVIRPIGAPYEVDVPATCVMNWADVQAAGVGNIVWLVVTHSYATRSGCFPAGSAYATNLQIDAPGGID